MTATNTFGADGLVSRKVPGGSYFYTFDPQGSVAQQLDGAGNVLCSYLHDGFGNWVASGADDVFGYGGQWGYYTDGQTGLRLCGRRFYDNVTGRWLTRDPFGYGGGVNLYGDCQNDPINWADPSGCDPTNGQIGPFPVSGTGSLGGGTTGTLSGGGGKPTTIGLKTTLGLGTIQTTITPPQRDQPPGAPIGKQGAGPGSGTLTGMFPILRAGPVTLQGTLSGSGKFDGSSSSTSLGVGVGVKRGRVTGTLQGTSTTTNTGLTTSTGTGTLGYNPGGGWGVGISQSGPTLSKGTTMVTVTYSG